MDRPCMLDPDKWRVRRFVTNRARRVVRPWQLEVLAPSPPEVTIALWGVWPPQWPLDGVPMLYFPMWDIAFRAAFDRSQFAVRIPPPDHHVGEDIDGQA